MLFKITGSFFILVSTTLLGYSFKIDTKKKRVSLENLTQCMKVFETEIRCNMNDIITSAKRVKELADKNNSIIFETFLNESTASDGKPLSEVWSESVLKCEKITAYSKSELKIISSFGTVLGNGDILTQVENIDVLIENINAELEKIKIKTKKTDDMCAKLGIYAGILIIIFLI